MADAMNQILEQWRKQAEASVRVMDAVMEATTRMREAQLAASQETHERVKELQKSLASAKSAPEMWGEQWNWALGCCERSAAHWRSLYEAMIEANGKIARCMQEGAGAAGLAPFSGEPPSSGYEVVDKAYRDMIASSQRFLQSATSAFAPPAAQAREPAK